MAFLFPTNLYDGSHAYVWAFRNTVPRRGNASSCHKQGDVGDEIVSWISKIPVELVGPNTSTSSSSNTPLSPLQMT